MYVLKQKRTKEGDINYVELIIQKGVLCRDSAKGNIREVLYVLAHQPKHVASRNSSVCSSFSSC